MKLSRITWFWIVLALLLGGAVYVGEIRGRQHREAAEAEQQQLFDFPAEAIETIAIEYRDRDPFAFEQIESESEGAETSSWQITEPLRSPASDPAMSFLVNLLVEGEQQQAFRIEPDDLVTYDLAEPFATLTITTREQPDPYRVALGRANFEGQLIYAQVDTPAADELATDELEIVLVPIDLQYAVERELNEWLAAPEDALDADAADETTGNDNDE